MRHASRVRAPFSRARLTLQTSRCDRELQGTPAVSVLPTRRIYHCSEGLLKTMVV